MNNDTLIPILVCGAVALLCYFLSTLLMGRDDGKIRDRLREGQDGGFDTSASTRPGGLKPWLERVGQAAAQPFMPKSREKQSGLRQQLSKAGISTAQAMKLVYGCKAIFLGVGLVGGYAVGTMFDQTVLGFALGGLIGYMLPV